MEDVVDVDAGEAGRRGCARWWLGVRDGGGRRGRSGVLVGGVGSGSGRAFAVVKGDGVQGQAGVADEGEVAVGVVLVGD